MTELKKAKNLKSISLAQIKSSTPDNCHELINAISIAVDKKELASKCSIVSIKHFIEVKAIIKNKTAKVKLEKKEKPGCKLKKSNEPKELQFFSYEKLKKAAKLNNGVYRGKLYATIETYTCDTKVNCPDCNGTSICHRCNGDKQIACTLCCGSTECTKCEGSGKYTCRNCNGNGYCTECDEGWITCDECFNGTYICSDCCGSGNYIDSTCNKCGGNGEYRYGVKCRTCHGTGRYVVKCRRCNGEGSINCDNCAGKGGWYCKECHGTGNCSHCRGNGYFTCKACEGTGTCEKCHGKGKIWCLECHGKGKCFRCKGDKIITCPRCRGLGEFQSFTEYSLIEKENEKHFFSIPIALKYYNQVSGNICYDGVIYDFFAKKASILNNTEAENSLNGIHSETLKKWLSLDSNSTFRKGEVSDDYLNTYVEIYNIPVTKIVIRRRSRNYSIWVIGDKSLVFYDSLPILGFWGFFFD